MIYIVSLQRNCTAEDVENLASELMVRIEDLNEPEFSAEIKRVLKGGDVIRM